MLNVYAQAAGAQQGGAQGSLLNSPIVMMLLIFGIFYFLLIRPQQKQQKDHKTMLAGLKKNDEIVTSGGIHGTIVNVKDKSFVVRIDDNVKVEVQKTSVSALKKKKEE